MASLKSRLERLKILGLDLEPASSDADLLKEISPKGFLPGWEKLATHVFMKITETNLEANLRVISPRNFESLRFAKESAQDFSIHDVPLEDISFFDLETTGLSGGSGTIAFLAGIGWFAGSDFITAQIFIDDFPGEAAALDQITAMLAERSWICSYNGKAFDLPLLRTRCIMNRIRFSERAGHIDALVASRRLWKRTLGSCALTILEESILGHRREADIPSAEIPRLWLDYSNMSSSGEVSAEMMAMMNLICSHNKTDILSLARLVLHIQKLYENPERYLALNSSGISVDSNKLARHLIALGRIEEGRDLLEEFAARGNDDALLMLAKHYKACRDRLNQARVLSLLGTSSYRSCLEKAKFAEHVEKDYEKAFFLAARAARIAETESLNPVHRENCEKRIRRIRKKIGTL